MNITIINTYVVMNIASMKLLSILHLKCLMFIKTQLNQNDEIFT